MAGLEYIINPSAQLDAKLHLGLDPEVGSSLDNKYTVTRVATKAAWDIPCVRLNMGRASGRSDGGCT